MGKPPVAELKCWKVFQSPGAVSTQSRRRADAELGRVTRVRPFGPNQATPGNTEHLNLTDYLPRDRDVSFGHCWSNLVTNSGAHVVSLLAENLGRHANDVAGFRIT